MQLTKEELEAIKKEAEEWFQNYGSYPTPHEAYAAALTQEREKVKELVETLEQVATFHPDGNPMALIIIAKQALEHYSKIK